MGFMWGFKIHVFFKFTSLYLVTELTGSPMGWSWWELPVLLGKTYLPFLPIFLSKLLTPPVGQPGKFQWDIIKSHEAGPNPIMLNSSNISAVFSYFSLIVPSHFLFCQVAMLVSSPEFFVPPPCCLLFARIHHLAFYIIFTSNGDVQSINGKHPFC